MPHVTIVIKNYKPWPSVPAKPMRDLISALFRENNQLARFRYEQSRRTASQATDDTETAEQANTLAVCVEESPCRTQDDLRSRFPQYAVQHSHALGIHVPPASPDAVICQV
jgi:hypothetical protein